MRKSVAALFFLFVVIQSFACCAQTVEGKPGTSPAPAMVVPATPTAADEVLFMLAADEVTHANRCEQLRAFGGTDFRLLVDDTSRSIQISVTGDLPGGCTREFFPVNGIHGSVGALATGEWEIKSLFGETLSFTVVPAAVPEPSTTVLSLLAASFICGQRRRKTI